MIRSCPTGPFLVIATVLLFTPVTSACSGGGEADEATMASSGAPRQVDGVPVQVDTIRRTDLDVVVSAPGRTEALREDRVRAPFASRVVSLSVTDGDEVRAGQVVAEVVSKNSGAALDGARNMLRASVTPQDSADARRAIQVAQQQLVRRPLRAPADGVVLSHAAEAGDYVDEGEVLLTTAESGAVFFDAQVSQGDLPGVTSGERARVSLPALGATPVSAVVHGVLPAASSENLSAPVRLDFDPARPNMRVGLFGTAEIVAGQRRGAVVVPPSAVLRDDVNGVTRLAVVDSVDVAHWIVVTTGIQRGGRLEIVAPKLPVGGLVIVDGQVGLPDSSRVRIRP